MPAAFKTLGYVWCKKIFPYYSLPRSKDDTVLDQFDLGSNCDGKLQ